MKSIIKKAYLRSRILMFLFDPFERIYRFILYGKYLSDQNYIKRKYSRKLGYEINLKEPRTFNEKMNWLKLNHFDSLMTICADKYLVRSYIKEKIGEQYLIPLLFTTKKASDIRPSTLPSIPHIIKQNHNSSGGIIVRNKDDVDNWREIRGELLFGLRDNYYWQSREPQYKNIVPRIVVEKLLLDEQGNIPIDYKFHYLNGKLAFIQVDSDRQTAHKRTLYDATWNHIPCSWEYPMGETIEKPKGFEEMSGLGAEIARDFIYVRVDFYYLNSQIFFGEITFHSDGGGGRFSPLEFDIEFGKMLQLNSAY